MIEKTTKYFLFGIGSGMLLCLAMFSCLMVSVSRMENNDVPPTETRIYSNYKYFTVTSTPTSKATPTIINTIPSTSIITYTPTITETPSKTPTPTKTEIPIKTQDIISLYTALPNRELYTYADNHIGELVVVRGIIFNINGNDELQIFAGGSSDYPMYLVFDSSFSGIYEDDYITVYAEVKGTNCGTNSFGGKICQPLLYVVFWEKK